MKKVIRFLSVAGLCAFLAIGTNFCGRESPQVEQSVQGFQDKQDIQGVDGNTLYSGTVVPPANLGNVGDFYLHTSNSNFYGPKTTGGWGTPISLREATGATRTTGAPGAEILYGTAEATAHLSGMRDYYLITTR